MAGKLVQIFEPINLGFNRRKLPSLLSKKPTNHLPPFSPTASIFLPSPNFSSSPFPWFELVYRIVFRGHERFTKGQKKGGRKEMVR